MILFVDIGECKELVHSHRGLRTSQNSPTASLRPSVVFIASQYIKMNGSSNRTNLPLRPVPSFFHLSKGEDKVDYGQSKTNPKSDTRAKM